MGLSPVDCSTVQPVQEPPVRANVRQQSAHNSHSYRTIHKYCSLRTIPYDTVGAFPSAPRPLLDFIERATTKNEPRRRETMMADGILSSLQ
jgi:hypothetical protein